MNYSLLMRMLDRLANLDEKVQPLLGRQRIPVAIFRDFDATDEFHDEIRPARFRRASIEYLRDVGMIHQSNRLTLGLEASNDAFGVHARLDDFQGDPTMNRCFLFRHEDYATAAFA